MGVIRVEHNENYTTMANYHLRDSRLSLRAMGLMSKMLSLPDDWDYSVAGLTKIVKEGRDAVRKALQELESAGYLIREQSRQGGSFAGCDYTLFERPQTGSGSPSPGNPSTVESPLTENPTTVNPTSGNPTQLNNEENKRTKQPKHTPAAPVWDPEAFERFWRLYPKKKDKKAAIQEWNKLRADRNLMRIMAAALRRQMASEEWLRDKGRAVPYPCRWLSHHRWEDEPDDPIDIPDPEEDREEGPEWI